MNKVCTKCKVDKPLTDFYWNKRKDNYEYSCKECHKERNRKNQENKRKQDPTHSRKQHLKRRYGIDIETYNQMYEAQKGRCAICHTPKEVLDVDHDHETLVVRQLLCNNCNRGIGHLQDSPEVVLSAYAYLRRYKQDA